jgi:hypothetical protein
MKFPTEISITRYYSVFEAGAGFTLLQNYIYSNLPGIRFFPDVQNSCLPMSFINAAKNMSMNQLIGHCAMYSTQRYKFFWPKCKRLVLRDSSNSLQIRFNFSDLISVQINAKEHSEKYNLLLGQIASPQDSSELLRTWDSITISDEQSFSVKSYLGNFGVATERYKILSNKFSRLTKICTSSSMRLSISAIAETLRYSLDSESVVHSVNYLERNELLAAYEIMNAQLNSGSSSRMKLYDLHFLT